MGKHQRKLLVAALIAAFGTARAQAPGLPTGGQVVAGTATIANINDRQQVITQGSDRAIINWQGFSVGTGNSWSVVDALKVDDTFGGAVSGLEVAPGDYDAENVTADLLLTLIAMKQNAEV